MILETIHSFFLWCTLINVGILMVWFLTFVFALAIGGWAYAQEKPKVAVKFEVDPSSKISDLFNDENNEVDNDSIALSILMEGLNKYVGFLDFTTEDHPIQLTMSLKEFGSGFLSTYNLNIILEFESDSIIHPWEFIDMEEANEIDEDDMLFTSSLENFLDKLKLDWEDYLKKSYNHYCLNLFNNFG